MYNFLIGQSATEIVDATSPSLRQLMQNFLYYHSDLKRSKKQSAQLVVNNAMKLWTEMNIQIRDKHKIEDKLITEYDEWFHLHKLKSSKSDEQKKKRKDFTSKLDKVFDVEKSAPKRPVQPHQRHSSGGDRSVSQSKKRRLESSSSELTESSLRSRSKPTSTRSDTPMTQSSPSDIDDDSKKSIDPNFEKYYIREHKKVNFINNHVVSTIDAIGLSDYKAARVLTAVAQALGHDLNDLNISRATIQRRRAENRKSFTDALKKGYKATFGVVHWDTKIMEDIAGHEKVDRMPVLVSQKSGVQLLGVPKIASGTGEAMAEAIYTALKEWRVTKNICAMSFDTTSTNTGYMNGACALLEEKLERKLLKLACRHHVFEIFLRAAFEAKFPGTSAPTVLLFDRFKKEWKKIDLTRYEPGIRDEKIKSVLKDDVRKDLVAFCKNMLKKNNDPREKKKIARHDYRELLELTLIFVGEDTGIIRFRAPGADHHARWMSKALYALKIFLFSSQFKLSKKDKEGLRDFCVFVVLFYTKAWFRCVHPLAAPKHDLEFLKAILKYEQIDKQIYSAVVQKICGHLWYLSPETIALSFFDDNVSVDEKRRLRDTLLSQPPSDESTLIDRLIIPQSQIKMLENWNLQDFITENTIYFFKRFNISRTFLRKDPSEWSDDIEYREAQSLLSALEVINDNAERSVKLMEDFNKKITKDEDMMQSLLLTTTEYRKKYPEYTKSGLTTPK